MQARDWLALQQASADILAVVCPNTEEIATVMRKRGSKYRTGSFHAAIHDLLDIAEKQHRMMHAEAAAAEHRRGQWGGTRDGAGRPVAKGNLAELEPPGGQ